MYKAEIFSKRMKDLVNRYNNRDGQILVSNDDVINELESDPDKKWSIKEIKEVIER